MQWVRTISAVLLALPLVIFGSNYFLNFFPLPPGDDSAGDRLLQAMRDGGLMKFIAFSHVVAGVLLLVPTTRFLGALLQLPMSIGITSFHIAMLRKGLPPALIMLALNVLVLVLTSGVTCLFTL